MNWMKQIILENAWNTLQLYTLDLVVSELHVTTHWKDHYTSVYQEWNRHWFSTNTTPVDIVEAPVNCFKREITSISVFNPNEEPVWFIIAQDDSVTSQHTIVVQILLMPKETWTLECICWCWTTWVAIYSDWVYVWYSQEFNFMSCLTAEINPITNHLDIWINLSPTFVCDSDVQWNLLFTLWLCWESIDMSCIATSILNIVDLQAACDNGNTTNTDIEITDIGKWIILKSNDWTRHRISLVDNWGGSYALDISAAL